jgi:hypothetical protein
MVSMEDLDNTVNKINESIKSFYDDVCKSVDCQQDKDLCVDCWNGDKYKSPDQIDPRENR